MFDVIIISMSMVKYKYSQTGIGEAYLIVCVSLFPRIVVCPAENILAQNIKTKNTSTRR